MGLAGIDISQHQATTPSLANLSFITLRASIGSLKDTMYDTHYANARKAGLVVMAYHYAYPEATATVAEQVAQFTATAKNADFLWLDQEQEGVDDVLTQKLIDAVRATGRPCGLYHSASGFGGVNADGKWIADWRPASLAAGYPMKADASGEFPGWDFWQWQGSPLDKDKMNPATTVAAFLRRGFVSNQVAKLALNAAVATAVAPLNAQVATLTATVTAREAANAALSTQYNDLLSQFNAATAERDGLLAEQAKVQADQAAARRLLGL